MQQFHFERLINKYSTDFIVEIPNKGEYNDAGDWVDGTPKKVVRRGAIINHRENRVFRSEGTLTAQDRALYMLRPIDLPLEGAKVIHKGKIYSISDGLQNAEFTNVWNYTLKYVSVFGGDK